MVLPYQRSRLFLLVAACTAVTACGVSPATSALPQNHQATPVPTSATTPLPVASAMPLYPTEQTIVSAATVPTATESIPSATPVPVVQAALTLGNVTWTLPQPQHLKPYATSNNQGVLWVHYPLMVTNEAIAQYDMSPVPLGDYEIFYTPVRQSGGSLSENAISVTTLPSMTDTGEVWITGIGPAGSTHFWVRTYTLPRSAQNGGLVQVFWIDPQKHTVQEIVEVGGTGGGHFLTMATNPRWLFWQQSDISDVNGSPKVQTALIDLEMGQSQAIDVGGAIDENSATWSKDSMLHYTQGGKQFIFNPETRRIAPAS